MNGQGSTYNSFPEGLYVDHGLDVNNPGFALNNVFPPDVAVHDSHTGNGWTGQSRSSVNVQNMISFQELLGEDGWLSSADDPDGTGQRFQGRNSGPYIAPFQESTYMFPSDGQVTNEPSILQGVNSGALTQNLDLNALFESNNSDANQDMGAGLSLSLFNPDDVEADQYPPANDSSIPLVISSGLAGYVLEEDDGREGLSSEGRRVSCKRRAPEDAPRLLSLGESSSSGQQAGNSEWEAVPAQGNANSGLNVSTPLIISSNVSQTSSGPGQEESSHRTIRLRRAANPQDSIPSRILSSGTTQDSHLQSHTQPTNFFPFDHFPTSSSAATLPVNATPPEQAFVHTPISLQNLQPSPWDDLTNARPDVSSIPPVYAVNGGDTLQQQNSRNIPRNTLPVPETERGNVAQNPTEINFVNGNSNSQGNVALGSRNGTLSGIHVSSVPTGVPECNVPEQYAQTRSTTSSAGFESRGWGSHCPLYSGTSAAAREMDLSVRGGNVRPFQVYMNSDLMTRPQRQAGGYPANPSAPQSIGATYEVSRLIAEVRNAVALVRRGRALQFEELLALEDHIGNVGIGLSEEAILANLRQRKYEFITLESPAEKEPCCICQEEYVDGDDLGKLDCGHDFHFTCVKQWLVLKNSCPICKKMALACRDTDN
ncbi:E3 ubiquitin-protein ligase MBR2-like isoform X2 [Corylus avellana]|uniref:E3 ubiquitin-protein ligase MBR2-like isoform X2 n=1 Tax=Corylus avellana TaxID=13451 RepID=UPI00286A16E5|nr:E3 ubiquitin-protein ligase MBR2-like isoform X2 [Corylus avellana]